MLGVPSEGVVQHHDAIETTTGKGGGRRGEDEARVVDNVNRMGDAEDNVSGDGNNESLEGIKPGELKARPCAQVGLL
ncbi:hypothetical protein CTI12_AA476830 [Artemisia annua]|uniref:Uncharacterized protein n=1 Tax=Artemisia annua TaxID=35608 RepID=A0A2U1LLW8_ARTAN|nr:hypothetical protein CTI12_AA476830 [Artemisia annua]